MLIKNKQDWVASARATLPRLSGYANDMRRSFDSRTAYTLLDSEKYQELHSMFEKLWADLPDSPGIREGAFFDLCDLCSEGWAIPR